MLKYYIKMALLKEGGPQIRLCLFMIRPITLKQLNSLTSIDTFCWLGGIKVTLQDSGARGPGFNSLLWHNNLCLLFGFVIVVILLYVQKYITVCVFTWTFAIPFAKLINFV